MSLAPIDPVLADVVRAGLNASPKRLPAWLFYDAEGSRLYEQITELPEYYPTRTEAALLQAHAVDIVSRAAQGSAYPLQIVELGAGTAKKTVPLLQAALQTQGTCRFWPVDVSPSALALAQRRLASLLPEVEVRPLIGHHEAALVEVSRLGPRRLVLFIGSSIGNYADEEAVALLRRVRAALTPGGALLLGTDLRKDPSVLVPAYDDAAGVTAAFNLNLLTRLNRELGARFDRANFRHVALWNEADSRIEMHLESTCEQDVPIEALDEVVHFARGERVHTESSVKYDLDRVDHLLTAAGFQREVTYCDPKRWFAVHLARAIATA